MITFLIGVFDVTVFNPFSALTAKKFERLEEHLGMTNSNPFSWSENGLWLREAHEDKTIVVRAGRVRQENNTVALDQVSLMELTPEHQFLRQYESSTAILDNGQLILKNPFVIDPVAETGTSADDVAFETEFTLEGIL